MSKLAKIALGFLVFLIIVGGGIGYHFYGLYEAGKGLKVRNVTIEHVDVLGVSLPLDLVPDCFRIIFSIEVENPSRYDFTIDEVKYTVYVEDNYLGEGRARSIVVPAETTTPIKLTFECTAEDILKVLGEIIKSGDTYLDYRIEGVAKIPVKVFSVKFTSIYVPFSYKGGYKLPISMPWGKPKAEWITAYWSIPIVKYGQNVTAIVEVEGPRKGTLEVIIMKNMKLLPDIKVYRRVFHVDIPPFIRKTYEIPFTPPEPSSLIVRGYYIVVKFNGEKVFEQEDKYPPRLKVER